MPVYWCEGVPAGSCVEFHLQFDREKTPERIVHARGMTAKGYFEVTHDISHLTSAAFLNGVGTKVCLNAQVKLKRLCTDQPCPTWALLTD